MVLPASSLLWDYIVFVVFLAMSTCLPLWSKNSTSPSSKADYVFAASGGVSMGAMMMSIARGTLGVRSFLGFPSELFYRGSAMWETLYGMISAYPIVCFVFLPVYYSLGITSVYQYLDLRFKSRLVRCLASGTFIWRQILNLGVTVFTPCVALNTIIGLPYWASIMGITFISIFLTVLGGLKAAIKADVIQSVAMILISFVIIVYGCMKVGSIGDVATTNINEGRLKFFDFKWDPSVRVDTMSAWLGQLFMSMSIFGCQQNFVQRYCSMSSEKKVRQTLMCNIPVIFILFSLSWVVGMVIYALYHLCDPLTAGYTKKLDEILPFFVEDQFSFLPGIMGLFLASLFNSALSMLVSNLNSLATVTWEDFLCRIPALRESQDSKQLMFIKILGAVYGIIIMGVSFGVGLLSGVIESSMLVTSATSGPLLGVFLMAILVPCANRKGAAVGIISSHIITTWLAIGHLLYGMKKVEMLPLSVEGCTNSTFSSRISRASTVSVLPTFNNSTAHMFIEHFHVSHNTEMSTSPPFLYSLTYMYYSLIGTMSCVIIGVIVSLICGADDSDVYDEKLIHPMILKLSRAMPGKQRKFTSNEKLNKDTSVNNLNLAFDCPECKLNCKCKVTEEKAMDNSCVFVTKIDSEVCHVPTICEVTRF